METLIIGNREFTAHKMNAFEANKILLRLNKIVLPVLGGLTKNSKGGSLMDMDLSEAAGLIAENLTEETMDTIVFPLFNSSKVYDKEAKMFIANSTAINQAFTADNLMDFYTLVWEVLKLNFAGFFGQVANRFGSVTEAQATPQKTLGI